MSKFSVVVVYTDMHIERLWLSHNDAQSLLSQNKEVANIYRPSTEQYALVIDGELVWKDLPLRDYVSKAG